MQNTDEALKANFPIWYSKVSVGDESDRAQKRHAGVVALAKVAKSPEIETLVRLTFKTKQLPNTENVTKIRQHFKKADELFPTQGNDTEMQILSGASLRAIMVYEDNDAAIAAISLITTGFGGARKINLSMDLMETAEYVITAIAESNRERPDLTSSTKAPTIDFSTAATEAQTQWDANGVAKAFTKAADLVNQSLSKLSEQTKTALSAANTFISIQDEELQLLWWLMGERSHDLDKPFNKVHPDAQPLIFAKELADATEFLPGPSSILGILAKAGIKESKKLTVPVAINACESKWLKSLVEGKSFSPVTQPIHSAIVRKLETDDNDSWVAGWAGVTDIKSDFSLSHLALAKLFYLERLLTDNAEA